MTSYAGWHAELYDLFYADKPYEKEAAFVDAFLREYATTAPRRLLELACGTGRHARAFEQLGYDVLATDASPEMLAVAERKAKSAGSRIAFRRTDMRTLDLVCEPFDAAVCLFDSLGYVITNEAVQQTLSGIGRRLRPGGLFAFEFWHSSAMLRGFDPVRVRRFTTSSGEVLRISETSLNVAAQTADVTYTIYDLHRDCTYRRLVETQTNRFFSAPEMATLLGQAGFEPLRWFAGFQIDGQINADVWHIVALARKQADSKAA